MPKLQASGAFAQALDDNARALNGAYWKVYAAGTTTQATTYSNALLTIANAWPVIGDAAGRLPDIYVAPGNYRIRVETAGGVLIAESDNNVVYGLDPGEVAVAKFKTVAILNTDETIGYALGGNVTTVVTAGDIVEADSYRYSVLASGVTDENLTTAGGVKLRVLTGPGGAINAAAFGADTGAADNSSALAALYAASPDAVTFSEFYPVTGNFARPHVPTYGPGGVRIGGVDIPLSTERVDADVTVYVSASGSDAGNHGLSSAHAFATVGRALQSCPAVLGTGVTYLVEVADGTYTTSAIPAADMVRPALIYLSGVQSDRSASSGGNLTGGVVVRGQSKAGTIIRAGSTYTYGAYATQASNLAIQNLTIDTAAACSALITGHRASYIQTLNVDVTGSTNATNGIVAEAGGVVECTGNGAITGSGTGVAAFDESLIVLSNDGTLSGASGSQIGGRGTVSINNSFTVSGNVTAEGATIILRGTSTASRVSWASTTTIRNCKLFCTFANISAQIIAEVSSVDLNASAYSNAIFMRGGALRMRGGATSYIAPATASTVANPVVLQSDAQYLADAGTIIAGSAGANEPLRQQSTHAITGSGQTIPLQSVQGRSQTVQVTSTGAHTGIVIATTFSDNSLSPARGDRVTLFFNGSNSAALSTSGISLAGSVTLGQNAGQVQGITLEWFGSAWAEISRSGVP